MADSAAVVVYDPAGYACNMQYAVLRNGIEVYRGPRWAAHLAARTGIPYEDQIDAS